jgi:hypothetical protein
MTERNIICFCSSSVIPGRFLTGIQRRLSEVLIQVQDIKTYSPQRRWIPSELHDGMTEKELIFVHSCCFSAFTIA